MPGNEREPLKKSEKVVIHNLADMKKENTNSSILTTLLIVASIWFMVFFGTTQNVSFPILCLGWLFLIPFTVLRLTWILAQLLGSIGSRLLIMNQFRLAQQCAGVSCSICSWWYEVYNIARIDKFGISQLYLGNLFVLGHSSFGLNKIEDAINIYQQMVDIGSASSFYCEVAQDCDFLSTLFEQNNDKVHAKHWGERAVDNYVRLTTDICGCKQDHANLYNGAHAVLCARLARDSQHDGFVQAAERRAEEAAELLSNCNSADTSSVEVALIYLMDFYFHAKNWEKFEPIAHRYLSLQLSDNDKNLIFHAGQASLRLGELYKTAGKYDQAEESFSKGIELAKQSGRDDLIAKGEMATAAFRQQRRINDAEHK